MMDRSDTEAREMRRRAFHGHVACLSHSEAVLHVFVFNKKRGGKERQNSTDVDSRSVSMKTKSKKTKEQLFRIHFCKHVQFL